MNYLVASVVCGGEGPTLPNSENVFRIDNRNNSFTPCHGYQKIYEEALSLDPRPEILILIHDDVAIYDPEWLTKVLSLFSNPNCVCVGLGGAPELGHESLYKRPYSISQLARAGYRSNQRDWQTHGIKLDGIHPVAVVDAFFMAVRTDFLLGIGGWPVGHLSHHCLDLWLGCEAARYGKEVWVTGVDCMHFGGGTSTKPVYKKAGWLQGGGLVSDHETPHKWLWEQYRDVLPIKVKG